MAAVEETSERVGERESGGVRVHIDGDRCSGCQECLRRCPTEALHLDHERWQVWADESLCVGCRQCERTCPLHAVEVEGPVLSGEGLRLVRPVADRQALGLWETRPGIESEEEARAEAERCLDCPDPTCTLGCPAHNDIPGFVRALAVGDIQGARDVLARTSVFPEVCSRVCDQATQCEGACSWSLAGGRPVAIGLLERFVADRAIARPPFAPAKAGTPSVAVVGAGPGGMAAALGLRQAGADVVLYERRSRPLGVLDWGIPAFTLPDEVAMTPLARLREAGVRVELGADVGKAMPLATLRARHDAVVLAIGASRPLSSPVPADHLDWVIDSTSFLVRAKAALRQGAAMEDVPAGARILVLGAGNTAMDVARSALRLGAAAVVCVDWMDERFARARPDELEEAREEGVEIRFRTSLAGFAADPDGERAALLVQTRQRSARQRPRVLPGAPERVAVDRVVVATGYTVETALAQALSSRFPMRAPEVGKAVPPRAWMASGLTQAGGAVPRLALEREWHLAAAAEPVADRVWVVGDARSGPATVVAAMAQGLAAARAVMRPLSPPADQDERGAGRANAATARATGLRVAVRRHDVAAAPVAEPVDDPGAESEGTLIAGLGLAAFGLVSCLTIVGLPLGVPMVVVGLLLAGLDVLMSAAQRRRTAARATRRRPLAPPAVWAVRHSGSPPPAPR